jgi:hypothetical protein
MPMVGKKKFAYSKKGKSAAKKYAKKTGKKSEKEILMSIRPKLNQCTSIGTKEKS